MNANNAVLNVGGSPAATLTWAGDNAANTWDHAALDWKNAGSSDTLVA